MNKSPQDIVVSASQLLAERIYTDNGVESVVIRISQPEKTDAGYFRCDIEFVGHEDNSIFAMGIDAVHAIDTTLWLAGSGIKFLNDTRYERRLQWLGASSGKPIGLPSIPLNSSLDGDFRDY